MNVPAVLQNIRSKHPVAYVVLYLFVVWVLLVIITHAIAFGAELLIASSDQPVVKWETTDECTDGTRTIYYNSPSLYQEFKVKIKDSKIVDAELGSLRTGLFIYNRSNRQRRASRVHGQPCDVSYRPQHPRPTVTRLSARMRYTRHHVAHVRNTDAPGQGVLFLSSIPACAATPPA